MESLSNFLVHLTAKEQDKIEPKYIKLLKQIEIILQKNFENRTNNDNNIINKFSQKSQYFSQLAQKSSQQLVRNLVKNGTIHFIPAGRIITKLNSNVDSVYVILTGRLGVIASKPRKTVIKQNVFQLLLDKAAKYVKVNRIILKHTKSEYNNSNKFTQKIDLAQIQLEQTLGKDKIYGDLDLLQDEIYTKTTITLIQSSILQIKSIKYMQNLMQYKQKLVSQKIQLFCKATSCFQKIQIDKLKILVDKSPMLKYKKNQIIFQQNQSADAFFILYQGQININKNTNLFIENPNNLYANRYDLINSPKSLPFADLTSVYNYHPKQKILQLGVITSPCLFGQQQIFQNIPRQVTAKVSSYQAKVYMISKKVFQIVLGDKKNAILEFKDLFYENITKKRILYRQQKLSQLLSIENKNNMDYFYINKNKNHKPNRIQIKKINQKVTPRQVIKKKQQNSFHHVSLYNSFNFTKIIPQQQKQSQKLIKFEDDQLKIFDLTHTVAQINQKLQRKQKIYDKKKLRRYSIDIKNPLFESTFFQKIKNQSLRIDNYYRKQKFSSISRQSTRPHSANTSRTIK